MNKLILLSLVMLLTACGQIEKPTEPNQKVRREVFMECLSKVPAGPVSLIDTKNNWAEVVTACGNQAYYISKEQLK